MPTIMLLIGAAMILGSVGLLYYFYSHPGPVVPDATKFEGADFPAIMWVFEGFALFAFGAFLFLLGIGWSLTGVVAPY